MGFGGIASLYQEGKEGKVSRETVKMFQKSWYLGGENLHALGDGEGRGEREGTGGL